MEVEDRTGGFDGTSWALGILKAIGSNAMEELSLLMPNLLSFLKHDDPVVVRQSIATGTSLFSAVLTEMALQLRNSNKVEGWLEEMWSWMLQFKDAVRSILEPRSTGSKALAAKFLENCFLLFTSDVKNGEEGNGFNFSITWLVHGHPTLNPTMLAYEANKILNLFLDILQSAHTLSTSLVVTVINCLASIAKKRPVHYNRILSILLDFDPNFQTSTGGCAASIQYAVRIALLGLLRCRHASKFESRDELLTVLLDKYPGDATKSFIRRMEKIYRAIEGNPHDTRLDKVDLPSSQFSAPVNLIRSRPLVDSADACAVSDEMPSRRPRLNADEVSILPVKGASDVQDTNDAIDNSSLDSPPVSSDLSPAEKMIVAIGALLAEGDKGVTSLDLLLSQIHPELLADIVIETMKHLPKSLPVSPRRTINIPPNSQTSFPSTSQSGSSVPNTASSQPSPLPSVLVSAAVSSNGINTQASDIPSVPNLVNDVKRDPRRDPRRLDPRRSAAPLGESSTPLNSVGINDIQGLLDSSNRPTTSGAQATNLGVQTIESAPTSNAVLEFSEKLIDQAAEQQISGDNLENINETVEKDSSLEGQLPSDLVLSPVHSVEQESTTSLEISENEGDYDDMLEPDMTLSSEDVSHDLPVAPLYVEQTNEQKKALCQLAMTRLIDYKQIQTSGRSLSCLSILARLVAQSDADDDLVTFFRKHIVLDYHRREGHDLSMHVLYHLYAVTVSDLDGNSTLETNNYEKFLLAVAKALLDSLPASDKSFSRLLGEAPFLTESAFKMLEDLCQLHGYENHKDACDGDRVSQGLGALWSLILGRPVYRQTCLDIALKCSVHSHDEVRAKAIRLVANKLFLLPYASERIEKFAQSMLFSVVGQHVSEAEIQHPASSEQMKETGSQETSVSQSHNSDIRPSESETIKDKPLSPHSVPTTPLLHAQRQTSLFFALCTKKPSLLHLVFDVYGRAPKVVRQSIHRHIPGLIRTLGPSDPKLLQMISEPPEGSENLITLVLQLMTEESTPSADLIASVKHLYDTKLKDVTILIPLLSSLSKDEVLPIFPRLVNLPLEKFQDALARILQGSAHTGPALTPVEVLVAIHDVDPVKHGVALKKITDACTACFEQRTVFTQHVLAKSLSHMVEQVPLPMLFMRTVIQAIGAFPTLIDFVMGVLSKLVEKQIWKMPKLWVGFLKLVSQTHPHSFNVLLQLPPPQLDNALNKYANLRSPLATYANQPNIRTSLSRQTLQVLGLTTQ